ncbi:MAG: hypothetical protein ACR2NU_00710 [Aeoliella sp.]
MERMPASPAEGFHFTRAMRILCVDIARRVQELAHIDMTRVAVGFCQTRKQVPHGLQASLTPLRFEQGSATTIERGRRYACQSIFDPEGREYLYLLNFYLPRFLNHSLGEKLTTVVHELWHISPAFDGDLRRHDGRCYVHGPSEREFDRTAARLAAAWLAAGPPSELYAFLRHNFRQLEAEYGHVCGERYRVPKLLPLPSVS